MNIQPYAYQGMNTVQILGNRMGYLSTANCFVVTGNSIMAHTFEVWGNNFTNGIVSAGYSAEMTGRIIWVNNTMPKILVSGVPTNAAEALYVCNEIPYQPNGFSGGECNATVIARCVEPFNIYIDAPRYEWANASVASCLSPARYPAPAPTTTTTGTTITTTAAAATTTTASTTLTTINTATTSAASTTNPQTAPVSTTLSTSGSTGTLQMTAATSPSTTRPTTTTHHSMTATTTTANMTSTRVIVSRSPIAQLFIPSLLLLLSALSVLLL
eukprot:GILI01007596.1.p2 GENE.GILI01007596.1~~GILI01007596.1.p2  ORF type:complete len:271 (+),score=48.17 GILI01007596.1:995-1807(+)